MKMCARNAVAQAGIVAVQAGELSRCWDIFPSPAFWVSVEVSE